MPTPQRASPIAAIVTMLSTVSAVRANSPSGPSPARSPPTRPGSAPGSTTSASIPGKACATIRRVRSKIDRFPATGTGTPTPTLITSGSTPLPRAGSSRSSHRSRRAPCHDEVPTSRLTASSTSPARFTITARPTCFDSAIPAVYATDLSRCKNSAGLPRRPSEREDAVTKPASIRPASTRLSVVRETPKSFDNVVLGASASARALTMCSANDMGWAPNTGVLLPSPQRRGPGRGVTSPHSLGPPSDKSAAL